MQKLEERRRKTWDHIKKIRNILSKNSTIKDRNGKDLTKQKRSRRDGKNTHNNCTKKDHKDPDNCDGVVTHPEPDILECEDKWALGSTADNKANVGDGIPAELFKNLKDNAIKVLLRWCSGKEYTHQCRRHKRHRFDFCVWKIPCSRKWQPIPVFLLGKFHIQRSPVGYSPWRCKESDMTEPMRHTHTHTRSSFYSWWANPNFQAHFGDRLCCLKLSSRLIHWSTLVIVLPPG